MRKIILAVVVALGFYACDNGKLEEAERNAAHQRDSLAAIINERDSSINDFLSSFTEIEQNLDSVAMKQNAISVNMEKQGELKRTAKDRINDNIQAINDLMTKNREKLAQLQRKLKSSGAHVAQLEKMIQSLNDQIAQKDHELADLNVQLTNLNAQVTQLQTNIDTLNQKSMAQAKVIDDQTGRLHTAYFIVGKSKDLQQMKVIDRTGGLLGIGRTSKLSPNVDNNKFTKIDFTTMGSIPVDSKSMKMVTYHPSDSYTTNKTKDKVVSIDITNPERFWSASKYLVVIKN